MGSGTTCVAAVMERRQYIGMEKDPTYFAVAEQRVAAVSRQGMLDL